MGRLWRYARLGVAFPSRSRYSNIGVARMNSRRVLWLMQAEEHDETSHRTEKALA